MVKLKRLNIDKIDPSVGKEGRIEFSISDVYLSKCVIKGIVTVRNDPSIEDNWFSRKVKEYCNENNIQCCTIYSTDIPHCTNIIMDDVVKELIEEL